MTITELGWLALLINLIAMALLYRWQRILTAWSNTLRELSNLLDKKSAVHRGKYAPGYRAGFMVILNDKLVHFGYPCPDCHKVIEFS